MNPGTHPFAGRRLCIATMHHKERVLRPLLERALGVVCVVPPRGFDTDRFGSFSGSVARTGTAEAAARAKAEAGMDAVGTDLAVASEGSFGPHPDAPMLACGLELVLLVDRRDGLAVDGRDFTSRTNHQRRECRSARDVEATALRIGFPRHGVLLTVGEPPEASWSGARTAGELRGQVEAAMTAAASSGRPWFAAADMRAHRNPTRMASIARAATALVAHVQRSCPSCGTPGFGSRSTAMPLPCGNCGESTRVTGDRILHCLRCSHRERTRVDRSIEVADPGACDLCNP